MNLLAPISFAILSLGALVAAPASVPASVFPVQVGSIVEVASAAGNFKKLLVAADAAGLMDELKGKGPLTVLAPTDKAFAELGEETLADLMKPENLDTLVRILSYHVISGSVSAQDALRAGKASTLVGADVTFSLKGGQLRVNGEVNVINNDIAASNGVIHVIDQVLIPPPPPGRLVIGFFSERPGKELASYLGVDRNASLLISSITKGGGAETAGVQVFDLIVGVNGRAATTDVLDQEKEKVGYGGAIHLEILRRGVKMTIDSRVGVEKKK